jgi:hypothetical protein
MTEIAQIVTLAVPATLVVSAADMLSGTWKVNIAKSDYRPGPGPKSGAVTYSMDATG